MPSRPPPIPSSATAVYKTVQGLDLEINIYLPAPSFERCPIALYIHGGTFVSGNNEDYCRPLFKRLLAIGVVVTSMNYRLLPESSGDELLQDIKDVEPWLRYSLPLECPDRSIDTEKLVVIGASVGGLLALLTPKLWETPPIAIVAFYAPTDVHHLLPVEQYTVKDLSIKHISRLLKSAIYSEPLSEYLPPTTEDDRNQPRHQVARLILGGSLLAFFFRRIQGKDILRLPSAEDVRVEEIDSINPLPLPPQMPPVYQLRGMSDRIFQRSHSDFLDGALRAAKVESVSRFALGHGHAFDIYATKDDYEDTHYIQPVVEWLGKIVSPP